MILEELKVELVGTLFDKEELGLKPVKKVKLTLLRNRFFHRCTLEIYPFKVELHNFANSCFQSMKIDSHMLFLPQQNLVSNCQLSHFSSMAPFDFY